MIGTASDNCQHALIIDLHQETRHKIKLFAQTVANMLSRLYLCIVFFIVLDLRLTKIGTRRSPFFLCPYVKCVGMLTEEKRQPLLVASVYSLADTAVYLTNQTCNLMLPGTRCSLHRGCRKPWLHPNCSVHR